MAVYHLVLTILFLVGVESQNPAPAAATVCSTLGEEGFTCSQGCKKLIHCIPNGNNSFAEQEVRTCPGEVNGSLFLCNPSSRDCSADTCDDGGHINEPLTCAENGKFPHPWLCTRYYTCIGRPDPTVTICTPGTAYDATKLDCTKEAMKARSCVEGPLGQCKSVDDVGAYPDDPSLYYVCSYNSRGYLLPQMRTCQNKYSFNNDKKRCTNSASLLSASLTLLLTVLPAYLHFKKDC